MDIHPIIVHFPVALLTLYAIFELVRFRAVLSKDYWFYVKATLAICGEVFSWAAAASAPDARGSALVNMHSNFAVTSISIFGIIAFGYAVMWLIRTQYASRLPAFVLKLATFLQKGYVLIPLAFIGLGAIVITGGLGGAIVYGTHFDPFMAPIFKVLGVY